MAIYYAISGETKIRFDSKATDENALKTAAWQAVHFAAENSDSVENLEWSLQKENGEEITTFST